MPTSPVTSYRRKLSGIERYSLVINEFYHYNVDAIVVGHGAMEVETLRRAVATAAAANPGVRVRLKSFLGFTQWIDSGIAPEVKAIDLPQWDFFSERGADFLQERFDPLAGGPIADVVLVRTEKQIGLVFRALHAAMDGRSLAYWISDVFRALRGEALVGGESTLTDFEVAERYIDKLVEDKTQEGNKVDNPGPEFSPIVPPSSPREKEGGYIWRAISIPRNVSNILPRAAVFLAQYARRQGDALAVGFTIPVDYRGLRVEANSNGNLTGYVRVNVGPDATPRNVMQQLNQQIRDYVDCKWPLMAKPLRWIPIQFIKMKLKKEIDTLLYTANRELPSGGLVSMGNWDPLICTTPTFTADFMLGIPGAVGKLNVLAVNLPSSTVVTFSAPKNYNLNGQIDQLAQDFAQAFTA